MRSARHLARTFVRQHDETDCGVACLAALVRYHGGQARLEQLRELSGTTVRGTTLLGMRQAARELGFEAEGLQAESAESLRREMSGPVILHAHLGEAQGPRIDHYVVCYGWHAERECFVVGDPARGLRDYSIGELAEVWPSRRLLTLTPTAAFRPGREVSRQQRGWLLEVLRADAPLLAIATALGVVTAALGLSTAIFSQKLIDKILPAHDTRRLWQGLVLLAGLLLARSAVAYLRGRLLSQQSQAFNNRLIEQFFGKLLRLPKAFFDGRSTGELAARLNDAERIQRTISQLAGNFVINGLFVAVAAVYIFSYSTALGLLALSSLPVYVGLTWWHARPLAEGYRRVMAASAINESQYISAMQGVEVVKAMGREPFFTAVTRATYGQVQQEQFELRQTGLRFGLVTDVAGALLVTALLGLTSYLVVHKQMALGEMVAVLTMAGSLIPAVGSLALLNVQLQEARVAFERTVEYAQLTPEPTAADAVPEPLPFETLQVQDLSFRFTGRPLLLRQASLQVRRGELAVVVGASGSGKSTLLQVLQRFYQPESGRILVDGADWQTLPLARWRRSMGVVFQHTQLFSGNVFDNICLGAPPSEAAAFLAFCADWGFDTYFQAFPQGYGTPLGEKGVALSGGQRQLVALARALYARPTLLLLDEPTAALDARTENFVLGVLERARQQAAVLVITHRPAVALRADRVYALDNGRLTQVAAAELPLLG